MNGLTSKPYVALTSSSLILFSGANPSVQLSSSAITLWSSNGVTSQPYVSVSSSGAALVDGSNQA